MGEGGAEAEKRLYLCVGPISDGLLRATVP